MNHGIFGWLLLISIKEINTGSVYILVSQLFFKALGDESRHFWLAFAESIKEINTGSVYILVTQLFFR